MDRFDLGDVQIVRIPELVSPAVAPHAFLANFPEDAVDRHRGWLAPHFFDVASGQLILSGHAWLIKTPRHNILVEACGGNHKPRPAFPRTHMLDTPWLKRLAEAGCTPDDIDFVLCTHLHVDHVGWFTSLEQGVWVPTFARARYLIDKLEYANWDPATRTLPPLPLNANCFEDSVTPVMESGQMTLVDPPFAVEDAVTIEPARGHTLGHTAVRVKGSARSAIISGDVTHTPLQIVYPQCHTIGCEDPTASNSTRRRLLEDCAATGALYMPTHFPSPFSALSIAAKRSTFSFADSDGKEPEGLSEALDRMESD